MAKKCEICNKEKPDDRVINVTNFRQCGNHHTNICMECYHEYASKFKANTCAADYLSLTRIFLKDHGIRLQNNGVMQCELCGMAHGIRIVQFPDNPHVAPMFMCTSCAERWYKVRDKINGDLPAGTVLPDNVLMDTISKLIV